MGRGDRRAWLFLFLEGPGFEFLLVFCLIVCNFSQVGVRDNLMKVMFLEGAEVGGVGRKEGAIAGVHELIVHSGGIFKGFLI